MANTNNRTPAPATLIVAMSASTSEHNNIAGLATTEKNNVAQPRLTLRKEKNDVVRTISPPLALVATTGHVSVSRNGDEPQEEHLADWLSLQQSHRGTISHKTVKKRCRDNQSRGRPRMNPSALAPARDPQDLVHSNHGVSRYRLKKHQLNRAAVVTGTPLGSRITCSLVAWPTNLAYVCISSVWNSSVARSLVRTAQCCV